MNQAQTVVKEIEKAILGKDDKVKLALSCFLAGGHLLIEDLPGMGKTTLAHALSKVVGLNFQRIQFTSDLLPSDITGSNIFFRETNKFVFQKGPVFTQLLLADELNRATPKAQSALLEAMEERQVSVDGESHTLPDNFFVIATQNPQSQSGTFELPESQLDRFLMRISLGYPDPDSEIRLLLGESGRGALDKLTTKIDYDSIKQLKQLVANVECSTSLVSYVFQLIDHTRLPDLSLSGLSTRAGLGLIACAKAWAFIHERNYVLPEDVQMVFPAVAGHRLISQEQLTSEQLCQKILSEVAVLV